MQFNSLCIIFSNVQQAQSQGAITFKIIPSVKEETPSKEGKVGNYSRMFQKVLQ